MTFHGTASIEPLSLVGRIHNVPTLQLNDPSCKIAHERALRALQELINDHSATCFIHWRKGDNGRLIRDEIAAPISAILLQKAERLASQSLSSGRVESLVLPSRDSQSLVAAPLPGLTGNAITVSFPRGKSEISQQAHRWQCCEVELVAAHLAIVQLTSESNRAANVPAPIDVGSTSRDQATVRRDEAALQEPLMHSWSAIHSAVMSRVRRIIQQRRRQPKTYAVAAIGVILVGLLPCPHVITCKVQCEPLTRRFVAAPFDAKLVKCEVEVGQSVGREQVLARLDGSEVRSQLAGLQAKLAQATQRGAAALAQRDASKAELERLEVRHLQREIEVLENRQMNLEIRSPIAGIIVAGDRRHSEGATIVVGETLFEVAPLDDLIAEIAIPQEDIGFVNSGMLATISLDGTPGRRYRTEVARIHPRSELRDDASIFIAEASIANGSGQLRPGMTGSARVRVGLRSIAWILFNKPYEALRRLAGW